jgi:hypothetical protein
MPSAVQRPARRTYGAVAAAVLVAVALTGCGAGAVTQTSTQASAVNGSTGQVGNLVLRDATIAAATTLAGAAYQPGGSAPLNLTLVNTGSTPDKLLSASSPVAGTVQITGDATIPAGTAVTVGNTGASGPGLAGRTIAIKLNGLVGPIRAGLTYPVTFRFEKAGELTAKLPVGYPTGELAERTGGE